MTHDSSYDNDRAEPVERIELGPPQILIFKGQVVHVYRPLKKDAYPPLAETVAPVSQKAERDALAEAIRQLCNDFTAKTGLVVEEIDIRPIDYALRIVVPAHTRYHLPEIKAVLP